MLHDYITAIAQITPYRMPKIDSFLYIIIIKSYIELQIKTFGIDYQFNRIYILKL